MVHPEVQARDPSAKPKFPQAWPNKSSPSHSSPHSATPSPQEGPAPVQVEVSWVHHAVQVRVPPV